MPVAVRGGGDLVWLGGAGARAYNPAMSDGGYAPLKLYSPADPSTYLNAMSDGGYEFYDPEDPSTFPIPVSGADSSYSDWQTTNPFPPRRYHGIPEIWYPG